MVPDSDPEKFPVPEGTSALHEQVICLQEGNRALREQNAQLATENQALQEQIHQLRTENAVLWAHPAVLSPQLELAIPLSECFDGSPSKFQGFMDQCQLLFCLRPQLHASNHTKLGLAVSLMTGEALDWASPALEANSPVLSKWAAFQRALLTIFDNPKHIRSTEAALRQLQQGSGMIDLTCQQLPSEEKAPATSRILCLYFV
uniref:DUF4939 domain-containing protein n=1 Tax=Terrapene triunguis TaxID=2587831 RepID=A0A674I505_9SAUR